MKIMLNRLIKLLISSFILLLITFITFLFSTAGWSGIFNIILIIIYLSLTQLYNLVFVLTSIKRNSYSFDYKWFLLITISSFILIMVSYGDCGDSVGTFNGYMHLTGESSCNYENPSSANIPFLVWPIYFLFHLALSLYSIYRLHSNLEDKIKLLRFLLSLGVIILALILFAILLFGARVSL
ncbi:MAG: hypothetical protein Q9M76_02855 [Candidatus Dojkabacteria bacterium]|nr:hypothetical protein [Candidatus Dojkabacteria bacterium]